jgi:hypothetical protein
MITYLISVDFTETGPFTLEQLEELAKERHFTWGHYVLKIGKTVWYPAWVLNETKSVLEKYFTLKSGDTGPAGGMVFFHDTGEQRHIMEAAAYDLGPAPGRDAEKLCAEYRANGVDWRFPDEDEMRSFARAQYFSRRGGKLKPPVLHWALSKKNGQKLCAICTQELCDTYSPYQGRPTSANGPWIGNLVETDESNPLYVCPIRLIKIIPKPEIDQTVKGWGAPPEPPV